MLALVYQYFSLFRYSALHYSLFGICFIFSLDALSSDPDSSDINGFFSYSPYMEVLDPFKFEPKDCDFSSERCYELLFGSGVGLSFYKDFFIKDEMYGPMLMLNIGRYKYPRKKHIRGLVTGDLKIASRYSLYVGFQRLFSFKNRSKYFFQLSSFISIKHSVHADLFQYPGSSSIQTIGGLGLSGSFYFNIDNHEDVFIFLKPYAEVSPSEMQFAVSDYSYFYNINYGVTLGLSIMGENNS